MKTKNKKKKTLFERELSKVPVVRTAFISSLDITDCLDTLQKLDKEAFWPRLKKWSYGDANHTLVNADEFLKEIYQFALDYFDIDHIVEVEKQLKQVALYMKRKKVFLVDLET